jgi:hypothetical protein
VKINIMKKIILALAIVFIHIGSFGQDVLTDFQTKIIGTWNWEQTETAGRASGNWVTPSMCSCSKKMAISDNGTYEYFEDGVRLFSGPYSVMMNDADSKNVQFLFVGGYFNLGLVLTDKGKLRLGSTSGCGDIFVYTQ